MLREISNFLSGRRKQFSKSLDLESVLQLLQANSNFQNLTSQYYELGSNDIYFQREKICDILKNELYRFKEHHIDSYLEVTHEKYSNQTEEKHYIDIIQGNYLENKVKSEPIRKVSISFILEKVSTLN